MKWYYINLLFTDVVAVQSWRCVWFFCLFVFLTDRHNKFPWWFSWWRVCLHCGRQSLGGETPWRRKWKPILVFLPGEFHGQKSLVGYSPWDHKELDKIEQLSMHAWTQIFFFFLNFYWSTVDSQLVLLSSVQQNESVIDIHISTLF